MKPKTIHPQIKTRNMPEHTRHVPITLTWRSAVKADAKNGIKAAPRIKITGKVLQFDEDAAGFKAAADLQEKHLGGVGVTRNMQHLNENWRKKASQACRSADTEAEALILLERGVFAASTGPSQERMQVKTFEAFQTAYIAEHGKAPEAKEIAAYYAELAKAEA